MKEKPDMYQIISTLKSKRKRRGKVRFPNFKKLPIKFRP